MDVPVPGIIVRLDSGDDRRVDKEEFTSDKLKSTLEKVEKAVTLIDAEHQIFVFLMFSPTGHWPRVNVL